MQPQLAAATDAAKDAGRQALETAQEVSQGAIEELKESASEHVGEVAQQAKGAGEQVKETAKEQRRLQLSPERHARVTRGRPVVTRAQLFTQHRQRSSRPNLGRGVGPERVVDRRATGPRRVRRA